jgi:hypothetical protein
VSAVDAAIDTARAAVSAVRVRQGSDLKSRFVIQLSDPEKISHARGLLNGTVTQRTHAMGLIVKQKAPYKPRWSYHLDPASISFFEMATEVCDANMALVEKDLAQVGGAFLPGSRWCPWSSRLVGELP